MCVYDLTTDEYFVGCLPDLQVTNKSKKTSDYISKILHAQYRVLFLKHGKNNAATHKRDCKKLV